MDEVFSSAALQQVKGAARRRLQRCMKRDVAGEQAYVTEQDWIDALAREIFKTKKLNDSTRQKALSQLKFKISYHTTTQIILKRK